MIHGEAQPATGRRPIDSQMNEKIVKLAELSRDLAWLIDRHADALTREPAIAKQLTEASNAAKAKLEKVSEA